MVIREATVTDLPRLRALAIEIFTVTFEKDNNPDDFKTYMAEAFNEARMRVEFDEPNAQYFVAMEGETMVGYARVRENDEVDYLLGKNHLELQRIYVHMAWQGKGIAQQLMEACEQVATVRKKDWIWLGVWEFNSKAQHFYQKYGYERFGEHTFMVGNDKQTDWLMRKKVIGNR